MRIVYRIALLLVIIGAVNWAIVGVFQYDMIATVFNGQDSTLSRIVYSLVGLAGFLCIPMLFNEYEDNDLEVGDKEHSNAYTNMNYQTEFGEEADFSEVQKEQTTEVDQAARFPDARSNRATELYENDGKGDKDSLV